MGRVSLGKKGSDIVEIINIITKKPFSIEDNEKANSFLNVYKESERVAIININRFPWLISYESGSEATKLRERLREYER